MGAHAESLVQALSTVLQGQLAFQMEKQFEDFLVHNLAYTSLALGSRDVSSVSIGLRMPVINDGGGDR
jgi:hypothetical protein